MRVGLASHDNLRVTQNTPTQQSLVPRSCQSITRVSHVGGMSRVGEICEWDLRHTITLKSHRTRQHSRVWCREVARVSHEYHTSITRGQHEQVGELARET